MLGETLKKSTSTANNSSRKTVCIIGGGVAGLVSAKVLKNDGFDVTVFEKESTIGGVWAKSRAYPGLRSNNPREAYAFSDFNYPESADEFPTAAQILRYLQSYKKHFKLDPHIRLETEVVSVSRRDRYKGKLTSGYMIKVRVVSKPEKTEILEFDHVVICNGVFSKPKIPEIAGMEKFEGKVIHSSQFTDRELVRNKRVVVAGAGKSAMDCAAFAAENAASSILVFRKPHWMIPRYLNGTRVDNILFNRFSEQIFPVYHNASKTKRIYRKIAAPLFWLWRKVVDKIVVWQGNVPQSMKPNVSVISGIENNGIGTEFYEIHQKGLAEIRKATIESISGKNRIVLNTGEQLDADVVIFATGWRQTISFLDKKIQKKIRENCWFQLYRHILPPQELDMGFIGYASSGNAPLTSEISAHWLSQHFRGELDLPDISEMEKEIEKVRRWTQQVFPRRNEGYFIGAYIGSYIDELMDDMGLETRRKNNFFSEYFRPFWAERYKKVAVEKNKSN
jgi:dimethylaniline monooxygenase (N-oxide forming)